MLPDLHTGFSRGRSGIHTTCWYLDTGALWGFPGGSVINNLPATTGDARDSGSIPGLGRSWQPAPVFLPGKFHGQRSLRGYSPWGHKESDTTKHRTAQQPAKTMTAPITYGVSRTPARPSSKLPTLMRGNAFLLSGWNPPSHPWFFLFLSQLTPNFSANPVYCTFKLLG